MLLGVAGFWALRPRLVAPPEDHTDSIAVLPFLVRGDPALSYLREGMVQLLSVNLDGAGQLRAVDPRALLGYTARRPDLGLDPERAGEIAAHFSAGQYVLGNVLGAGRRVRVDAALYDRRVGGAPVAYASVEGDVERVLALVDQLTAQLLERGYDGPSGRLTRAAARTTGSLPALKAFLRGEAELRSERFVPALESFREAVARDSSFALAWYRLSVTLEWLNRIDEAMTSARRAIEHPDRLSEHDGLLVHAWAAFLERAPEEAEARYRALVARYPDDVEAWYQLGETLFHFNPYRGRPSGEAREAFERALRSTGPPRTRSWSSRTRSGAPPRTWRERCAPRVCLSIARKAAGPAGGSRSAALRQAEIYERLGRSREAADHLARFIDLWRDCDPDLRPLVDDARRRLARL